MAANLSPALIQALRDAPDLVDAVKVSEFGDPEYVRECRTIAAAKRLVVHGLCQYSDWGRISPPPAGNPGFRESIDLEALRRALEIARPAYVSTHLELLSDDLDRDRFLSNLVDDVEFIRDLTGVPVHLENCQMSRKSGMNRKHDSGYVSDPPFIEEVLAATGARLLLDIAHAQVAAWHKDLTVERYVDALPLDKVDEVHASAPAMVDGELRDRHVAMDAEGYRLLKYVLARAQVKTVSLEYGGYGPIFESRSSLPVLVAQLVRLRGMG